MKIELTYRKIFIIWFPLALSWLMMSVEWPLIAAVIARMADAKYNLAAHGVAFSFALIIEAPIINITSAAAALCRDRESYVKLRNTVTVMNICLTACMLFLLLPQVFGFLVQDLVGLPDNVAALTHTALVILLPWPAAIGFRRLFQGILIAQGRPRRVTYGTVIRVVFMGGTAFYMYRQGAAGAYAGAAALSAGVVAELIAARIMALGPIRELKAVTVSDPARDFPMTYGYIARFYYPLALVSLLDLGVQPMITFFMGKSRFPIESLAALTVVTDLCLPDSLEPVDVPKILATAAKAAPSLSRLIESLIAGL